VFATQQQQKNRPVSGEAAAKNLYGSAYCKRYFSLCLCAWENSHKRFFSCRCSYRTLLSLYHSPHQQQNLLPSPYGPQESR